MTDSDRAELGALLTQALGFYGQTLSPFALGVWWQACRGLDIDAVRKALTAHALDPDRGHFAPKPSDLMRQIHGDADEAALIAWGRVIAAARVGGALLDGPAQDAVEAMGGMRRIRMADESETGFLQREFVANFKAYKNRSKREQSDFAIGNVSRLKIGDELS